jgi:hypothetical protein
MSFIDSFAINSMKNLIFIAVIKDDVRKRNEW